MTVHRRREDFLQEAGMMSMCSVRCYVCVVVAQAVFLGDEACRNITEVGVPFDLGDGYRLWASL